MAHGGLTEQPHKDIEVTLQNNSAQNPAIGSCGIQWDEMSNSYKVIGVICLPNPPIAVLPTWNILGSIVQNPGGLQLSPATTSEPLNHLGNFRCMKFEKGNNANGKFDLKLHLKVVNGETIEWEDDFYVKVFVFGGPLEIKIVQEAETNIIFTKHPNNANSPPTPNVFFPWYCTDLGYNPFNHRSVKSFRPNSLTQPVNVFQARPLWSQPDEIKIWYSLSAPGVFLNPDSELSDLYGSIDPQQTRGLPRSKWALVACDTGSQTEFQISAGYAYWPGEEYPNPPFPAGITDDSNRYYAILFPLTYGNKYANFTPHRPHTLTELGDPPNPFNFENFPDWQARVVFFWLRDTGDGGMPGVWVQERWPSGVPPGFVVNPNGSPWITQRAGNIVWTHPVFGTHDFGNYLVHGVMQPDYLHLLVSYWNNPIFGNPLELQHEYHAGTSATAIGASPSIFIISYDLTFYDDGTIVHTPSGGIPCLRSSQFYCLHKPRTESRPIWMDSLQRPTLLPLPSFAGMKDISQRK